jgi:hypothetical protein
MQVFQFVSTAQEKAPLQDSKGAYSQDLSTSYQDKKY